MLQKIILFLSVSFLLAGCIIPTEPPIINQQVSSPQGNSEFWEGTWQSSINSANGKFRVNLYELEGTLLGDINIEGSFLTNSGRVSGSREGDVLDFGFVTGQGAPVSYTGTMNGDKMSGTWKTEVLGQIVDQGNWSASKGYNDGYLDSDNASGGDHSLSNGNGDTVDNGDARNSGASRDKCFPSDKFTGADLEKGVICTYELGGHYAYQSSETVIQYFKTSSSGDAACKYRRDVLAYSDKGEFMLFSSNVRIKTFPVWSFAPYESREYNYYSWSTGECTHYIYKDTPLSKGDALDLVTVRLTELFEEPEANCQVGSVDDSLFDFSAAECVSCDGDDCYGCAQCTPLPA